MFLLTLHPKNGSQKTPQIYTLKIGSDSWECNGSVAAQFVIATFAVEHFAAHLSCPHSSH